MTKQFARSSDNSSSSSSKSSIYSIMLSQVSFKVVMSNFGILVMRTWTVSPQSLTNLSIPPTRDADVTKSFKPEVPLLAFRDYQDKMITKPLTVLHILDKRNIDAPTAICIS